MSECGGNWWESSHERLVAELHQANRRAAAFEARCAQLLEENERLRAERPRQWVAKSCACYVRGNCGCGMDILRAERDEFKAAAEHWRQFHHKAEQRARDVEAENERLRDERDEARIGEGTFHLVAKHWADKCRAAEAELRKIEFEAQRRGLPYFGELARVALDAVSKVKAANL